MLEARRDKLCEEIGRYPAPIPACDVHFNRLLEERAAATEELLNLDALYREGPVAGRDAAALEALIERAAADPEDRDRLRGWLERCSGAVERAR